MDYKSIEWIESSDMVRMLDQRLLPGQVEYLDFSSAEGVAMAIKDMVIRGAPAIGAAAAYGLAVEMSQHDSDDLDSLSSAYEAADEVLRKSRPTAVNLFWALDRMSSRVNEKTFTTADELKDLVLSEAHAIAKQDVEICKQIGLNALELVPEKATAIHHCNTGGLATVGYGTALGIIRTAHEQGRDI